MSQENVEVAQANFRAWNDGDMDAVRETYSPEVILRPPAGWPEPGPFVGREKAMRQWEEMRATWDADELEPVSDFIHGGDLVAVRHIWRGMGQGPTAEIEVTNVFTVREGKIVNQEFFWNHAEALKAVGLEE